MQPYFVPYTGYFRLFAQSDCFVVLDDVQFTRRGWVHRNRFKTGSDQYRWLTLPLEKAPQDVLINQLRFKKNAADIFAEKLNSFDCFRKKTGKNLKVVKMMCDFNYRFVDYLENLLGEVCDLLKLDFNIMRSSNLGVSKTVKGSQRIIEIAKKIGATTYINLPGGRALYDEDDFIRNGLQLEFLPDWNGDSASIVQRILTEDRDIIRQQIINL